MGQRFVELQISYEGFANKTAVLHVSQLPPNAALITPGPAYMFVVVNGVPSVGVQVMVGSGKIEMQQMQEAASLPERARAALRSWAALSIQVRPACPEQPRPSPRWDVSHR